MSKKASEIGMGKAEHILVVDDDAEIRELIREYFTEEGFRVSVASDGNAMRQALDRSQVDLVLLDVRLPGEDGLALAAELRRRGESGIIMLSRKTDLVDRVAGLEVGADDYVAKPFELRELLARVRSVLRRRPVDPVPAHYDEPSKKSGKLYFADYELDQDKRSLLYRDARLVDLSSGEFDLLITFLEHPKRTLSRDQILDYVGGRAAAPFDRSIDVQVGRLRRKIEANPRRPKLIKTIRGAGYMLDAEVRRRQGP